MARVFISGSSSGLGLMAGALLINQGHQVVLHARNAARADDAKRSLPRAEAIVAGDLESIAGAREVAARVNELGRFDAVIHNVAVGYRESHHLTADGLPHVFAINTLSVYILSALLERPHRLVYLRLRHAPSCRRQSRRHSLEKAPLERLDGLCRKQTARRGTCHPSW